MEIKNKMIDRFILKENYSKPLEETPLDVIKVEYKFAVEFISQLDRVIIKELYNKYKEFGANELVIINEDEFKKFIEICLPKYLKGEIE